MNPGLAMTPVCLAEASLFGGDISLSLLWLAAAGVLAGIINTLAGGGGFLILPAMFAAGLSPGMANGTLRVGVALQNIAGVVAFGRAGLRPDRVLLGLAPLMCVGAGLGAWTATRLDDELLRAVIGVVLVAWAAFLLVRPGKFDTPDGPPRPMGVLAMTLTVAIGFYGGFLQAGVGFPLMALLVSYLRYPPVQANAIKVAGVLAYTLVAIPVFVLADRVDWIVGAVVGVASMLGAWIGAHSQMRFGPKLVRYVLIGAVATSGVAMLIDRL